MVSNLRKGVPKDRDDLRKGKRKKPPKPQGAPVWPALSTDTSRGNQFSTSHPALDVVGRMGERLSSPVTGVIVGPIIQDPDYGLDVSVRADSGPYKGYTFHMAHLSGRAVRVGQTVRQGEYLGMVGSSGRSTGPHIHLEVYNPGGVRTDPRVIDWAGNRAVGSAPNLSDQVLATTPLVSRSDKSFSPEALDLRRQKVARFDEYAKEPSKQKRAGIPIATIPGIGQVTVAQPGELFTRVVVYVIAAIVAVISLAALIGQTRVGRVGTAAVKEGVGMIPGVGEAKTIKNVIKAA